MTQSGEKAGDSQGMQWWSGPWGHGTPRDDGWTAMPFITMPPGIYGVVEPDGTRWRIVVSADGSMIKEKLDGRGT